MGDVKRIIVGIVAIAGLLGAGYAVKVYDVLNKQQKPVENQSVSKDSKEKGEVAGEEINIPEEQIKQKIDTIKKDVSNLKPEDIAKQEPVKKIVQDLENLKSSTQQQVTEGAKDAVCDQAKKLFCQ